MLIICYTENNQKQYTETQYSIDEWKSTNPSKNIEFVFDAHSDIITNNQSEMNKFIQYCDLYGFKPSDYNATFQNRKGEYIKFVGFIPKNKKYKCRIYNITKDEYYKVTPAYIKENL